MFKVTRNVLMKSAFVCVLCLFARIAAFANTRSGNQNPDLLLTVTVASSGKNSQMATVGDTVTTTWTVENTTSRILNVKVVYLIAPPSQAVRNVTRKIQLQPHGTFTNSVAILIQGYMCPGTFRSSFKTTDDLGRGFKSFSSATATVTDYL